MTQGTKVDWGAAIPVNGTRPEWLKDDQALCYHDGHRWYGETPNYPWTAHKVGHQRKFSPGDFDDWPNATAIRLPADHPYYTQPTPTNEVRERMEALTRRIASLDGIKAPETPPSAWVTEARAIVALLDPVDGDMIEARRCAADWCGGMEEIIMSGADDSSGYVTVALAAIKRGRALAEAGK